MATIIKEISHNRRRTATTCLQPQTWENLEAVEIMRLENIIILNNKVGLMKTDADSTQHD